MAKGGWAVKGGAKGSERSKAHILSDLWWHNTQDLTCILGDTSWNKNQALENQVFAIDHLVLKIRLLTAFFVFF